MLHYFSPFHTTRGGQRTVNNKKVKIHRAQKGFMKVDVPSGKGKVVLTFIPYGLKIGLID